MYNIDKKQGMWNLEICLYLPDSRRERNQSISYI